MKGVLTLPRSLGLEFHYQMQFSVIARAPFFVGRGLSPLQELQSVVSIQSTKGCWLDVGHTETKCGLILAQGRKYWTSSENQTHWQGSANPIGLIIQICEVPILWHYVWFLHTHTCLIYTILNTKHTHKPKYKHAHTQHT